MEDIFELLKIVPQYDADGKRLPLVYELLKMMPEFTKDGQEKPLVFAIKNRVKKVAKGIVSPLTLTYKPKKEQEQTSQGKTEAKGKDEKQTDAQKSVKDKAKEVSKKPAKKAGGSEPKGQLGIIHGSASAVKAGSVKGAKPEETKIGGFGSYKNEGVSVGSALNQTKSGEEKNSAIQQPSESKTNNSKPVSISTQQAPVNNKDGTFEDKNIDEVNTSYMFINEEEMEK